MVDEWHLRVLRASAAYDRGVAAIEKLEAMVNASPESFAEWILADERPRERAFQLLRKIDPRFRKGGASDKVFAIMEAKKRAA